MAEIKTRKKKVIMTIILIRNIIVLYTTALFLLLPCFAIAETTKKLSIEEWLKKENNLCYSGKNAKSCFAIGLAGTQGIFGKIDYLIATRYSVKACRGGIKEACVLSIKIFNRTIDDTAKSLKKSIDSNVKAISELKAISEEVKSQIKRNKESLDKALLANDKALSESLVKVLAKLKVLSEGTAKDLAEQTAYEEIIPKLKKDASVTFAMINKNINEMKALSGGLVKDLAKLKADNMSDYSFFTALDFYKKSCKEGIKEYCHRHSEVLDQKRKFCKSIQNNLGQASCYMNYGKAHELGKASIDDEIDYDYVHTYYLISCTMQTAVKIVNLKTNNNRMVYHGGEEPCVAAKRVKNKSPTFIAIRKEKAEKKTREQDQRLQNERAAKEKSKALAKAHADRKSRREEKRLKNMRAFVKERAKAQAAQKVRQKEQRLENERAAQKRTDLKEKKKKYNEAVNKLAMERGKKLQALRQEFKAKGGQAKTREEGREVRLENAEARRKVEADYQKAKAELLKKMKE